MKMKKTNRRVIAWCMLFILSITPIFPMGVVAQAEVSGQTDHALQNPVIVAGDGQVLWDCITFGNYWQSEYITSTENRPQQGEDDVVHTDTDGTKYIVREDKSCYKWEPIKWRLLSINEDGTDAFLLADKSLDAGQYNTTKAPETSWENCSLREWLNGTFMTTAFTADEQKAIVKTEIENKCNPYYGGGVEKDAVDGNPTEDYIYLLSIDEMIDRKYGFVNNYIDSDGFDNKFDGTQTRAAESTDFAKSNKGGDAYLLRTIAAFKGFVLCTDGLEDGGIPVTKLFGTEVDAEGCGIRPVLHLDLTKTDGWNYAGQVKQDKTEIAPDATPEVPTPTPIPQPGVTMAPGQIYPKNPVVDNDDHQKNTWDCIYFGNYYNTNITPAVLSEAGEHGAVKTDENGEKYITLHEQGYFQYEPIKWRVLSINEDGTDAFLMADQVVDVAQYFDRSDVEITWEKSNIRTWLNQDFLTTAFTPQEEEKIYDTNVKTADNPWSNEPGGNDTIDKVYLPSIEEMLEPDYGFSSDAEEMRVREVTATNYARAGGTQKQTYDAFVTYWLRSPGKQKGYPAATGWYGEIPENGSQASNYLGVCPVMHVDLSDTTMWSYAGQVTPEGVVIPETEDQGGSVSPSPDPEKKPVSTVKPPAQTEKPQQTAAPNGKKPGKPVIGKLKNKKGKKVTVTLSKKISGAAGYQVAYATKSSMKGQKKKAFKGTSVTVKGLKKKKKYYFRVRAYTKNSGKKVYGKWSNKKSIKIKK
ncbi:MAG: fibronectin type III domain-containing protein [Lachnospiraceae bacterium]|nr:fibronectin type III domain-containing protein [Lachnospiraceae bacterium]